MSPTTYFFDMAFGGPAWLRWAMLGVIVLGCALGALFFAARADRDPAIYSPRVAWLRAWIYYCFILVFSWVTGVLGFVLQQPLVAPGRTDDLLWLGLVAASWLVAIWGYVFWWPRGTLNHGRKLYVLPTLVHGAMWGLCAGLLYLSLYAILEQFGLPALANGVLLFGMLAVYSLNYQVGWWDIHVSPPHNLLATNNGKVALAHQPFLLVTLTYFVVYGDAGMFVLLTVFAMTCSALAMRFPPFWLPDGGAVSRHTAMGE
jgi:hypothetical protein